MLFCSEVEQAPKKPWTKGGPSPHPGGRRPAGALALSTAIRDRVDPVELIAIAMSIARDPEADDKSRLSALSFIAERGWVKPPSLHAKRLDVVNHAAIPFPPNWSELSPAARGAWIDALPPLPPLLGTGDDDADL